MYFWYRFFTYLFYPFAPIYLYFRKIRKKNPNFIKLCLNPSLVNEITLQPLKRFDLDAAIIFSDILMVPYGLNQKIKFKKNKYS